MSEPSRGSASVPTLRFPRPQGNQRLANWISSSSPDIMAQAFFVDEDGAVDSYELINTDGETESQDGLTAGSTASSLDLLARPSDDESLSGADHIYEYETHDVNIHIDEPQDYTEEVEQAITHEDDEHESEVDLVTPAQTLKIDKNIEVLPIKPSKVIEPQKTTKQQSDDKYTIMDHIRHSAQTPDFLHKAWIVLAVLATLIVVATFNTMGAALIQSPIKACEQPISGQIQQALITTAAVKPPTTITTTVTTTSTVLPPAFSDIAKKLTGSAEGVAKSVEETYLPALFAYATKIRGEVADWGKTHGLTGDALVKARNEFKDRVTPYIRVAEDSANNFRINVLKAQIKSRLVWLQLRGEMAEYQRYQTQARDYLKAKHHQMLTLRALRDRKSTSTSRWGRSHLRHIFH
ncbi:hypothetical protein PpBr36_03580 [Pyricularia pennisetigena]|uniref:hypothetical protein n=1 Tax=Pyricularia pennisetigena TaxID=1578925 RepID=UPI00115289DF|nr:hypothetical protein PpBr36_03580 [Pyricularia pennisetigena]TLS30269.1 hypothetical protein PpBr36_03580 [Pyricularia pennisetigena]